MSPHFREEDTEIGQLRNSPKDLWLRIGIAAQSPGALFLPAPLPPGQGRLPSRNSRGAASPGGAMFHWGAR